MKFRHAALIAGAIFVTSASTSVAAALLTGADILDGSLGTADLSPAAVNDLRAATVPSTSTVSTLSYRNGNTCVGTGCTSTQQPPLGAMFNIRRSTLTTRAGQDLVIHSTAYAYRADGKQFPARMFCDLAIDGIQSGTGYLDLSTSSVSWVPKGTVPLEATRIDVAAGSHVVDLRCRITDPDANTAWATTNRTADIGLSTQLSVVAVG